MYQYSDSEKLEILRSCAPEQENFHLQVMPKDTRRVRDGWPAF
jgi:hypothetical protein